ncbi:MAG: EAL domain-containing protein [Alphaproteobacteria bacterium]|nr:EAL domain-containing protein [Alphaproteobacteria bacterium]
MGRRCGAEAAGTRGPDLPVAFNLSSDSLGSNDFTRMPLRRLSEARGLAHKLVIEVSETSITQLNASAWKCLVDLRGLAAASPSTILKGSASFSQLRENTFDVIKIDRVLTGRIPATRSRRRRFPELSAWRMRCIFQRWRNMCRTRKLSRR